MKCGDRTDPEQRGKALQPETSGFGASSSQHPAPLREAQPLRHGEPASGGSPRSRRQTPTPPRPGPAPPLPTGASPQLPWAAAPRQQQEPAARRELPPCRLGGSLGPTRHSRPVQRLLGDGGRALLLLEGAQRLEGLHQLLHSGHGAARNGRDAAGAAMAPGYLAAILATSRRAPRGGAHEGNGWRGGSDSLIRQSETKIEDPGFALPATSRVGREMTSLVESCSDERSHAPSGRSAHLALLVGGS